MPEAHAAGWSRNGLAQLYGVNNSSISLMTRSPSKGRGKDPLPRATSYSVKLEQRIEEALIAIRLDCWDYRKKAELDAQPRHSPEQRPSPD